MSRKVSNKHFIWHMLKLGAAFSLIAAVMSEVTLESIGSLWVRISVPWFVLSLIAFYAALWSMARRYWLVIGKRVQFDEFLQIVLYQNILGNLITTTAGAAWYVGSLRNKHNIQVTTGVLSLLIARFVDLLLLSMTLSFATLFVWRQIPSLHSAVPLVILLLIAAASMSLVIFVCQHKLVTLLDRILGRLYWYHKTAVRKTFLSLTVMSNEDIVESSHHIGAFTVYSLLTLSAMLLFAYSSLQIFGIRIDLWPVIFVGSLTQIIALIPVQTLGGLGIYDFTYLYLYGLFGFSGPEFAAVILGLRLCFYVINALLLAVVMLPSDLLGRLFLRKRTS